jgi:PKD repeat protein
MIKYLFSLLLIMSAFPAFAQYCIPTYGNACTSGDYIDGVQIGTINNVGTNCSAPSSTNYTYYNTLSTNLMCGQPYTFTVTPTTAYTQGIGIWIDFNQNQSFADAGEFLYATPNTAAPTTGSFTIPFNALSGTTVMRVRCAYAKVLIQTDDCNVQDWGETEDYNVNILPLPTINMSTTNIQGAGVFCGVSAAFPISIDVKNMGQNIPAAGTTVSYKINNNPTVTENMSVTASTGNSQSYTFATTANLSLPNTYNIKAWITAANDNFHSDDTTTIVVNNVALATLPYFEDFENGTGYWQSGGTLSSWELATPNNNVINSAASGIKSWITNANGNYNTNEVSYVESPCFDFTNTLHPVFSFKMWVNAEIGYDGAILQYSDDGGATWNRIGSLNDPNNWYNATNLPAVPGSVGWGGTSQTQWKTAKHDIFNLGGLPQVRFRVAFFADYAVEYNGFAFDDIFIYDKPMNDMMVKVIYPSTGACANTNTAMGVLIRNEGLAPQTNIPVTMNISVAVNQNFSGTYLNTLAPYAEDTLWLGNILLPPTGNLNIKAYTQLATDQLLSNDTLKVLNIPILPIPNAPTVLNGNGCANTNILLAAAAQNNNLLYWYDAATNGSLVHIGSPFLTPPLTQTTTYYVEAKAATRFHFAPPNASFGNTSQGSLFVDGLLFDVAQEVLLDSVTIYPYGIGNVVVNILDSNDVVLHQKNIAFPSNMAGQARKIPLGFLIPAGIKYKITANGTQMDFLLRNSSGATYPYSDVNQAVTITGTTNPLGNAGYYYFFYDWVLAFPKCPSSRVAATANVYPSPVLNFPADTIGCNSLTLDAGSPFGFLYSWNTGASTHKITITNSGTYTVSVTNPNSCVSKDTIFVEMDKSPQAIFGYNRISNTYYFSANVIGTQPFTYHWDFGDGSTSPQPSPIHTYSVPSNYTITLIVNNICGADTSSLIEHFVGIENEMTNANLHIFPNPNKGHFELTGENLSNEKMQLSIYDINGKIVYETAFPSGNFATSVQLPLAAGMYFVKVKCENQQSIQKLWIENE